MNKVDIPSMEPVIVYAEGKNFPRISNTVEHILDPHRMKIMRTFNILKEHYKEDYELAMEQGILEIGCGHSYPWTDFFETHPLQYYLGIDLAKQIGESRKYFGKSLLVIRGGVDAFSFLEGLPDNSIPYCFLSAMDSYILGDEGPRLSKLLDQKVAGKIFVYDSAVYGNKVIYLG